jgi:hypothetical protein
MKKFHYKMYFSPYDCIVYAKNMTDARKKIKKAYPEYNITKTLQYLSN